MTAVLAAPNGPNAPLSMPGWAIVADLTPPELIAARRLGVLRRRIISGLAIVALLCGATYASAARNYGSASDEAGAASVQTVTLQHAAGQYAGVTKIEAAVAAVRAQVASVMKSDVDVVALVSKFRAALPASMSIQDLTVTLTPTAAGTTTGGLDASGHAEIGTVAISGSGRTLDDLATFVERLSALRGVVNVLPSSNVVSDGRAQFNLTLALTDVLYSHRFDVQKSGGK